jgi:hypothetical protein
MWQSTQSIRACGETRYAVYSGGIVWHEVPQNSGELVYSQPYAAAVSKINVSNPSVAYGATLSHVGDPAGGKKNLFIAINIFFINIFLLILFGCMV